MLLLRRLVLLGSASAAGAVALISTRKESVHNNNNPSLLSEYCNKTVALCEQPQEEQSKLTLKLVQVIFRHGARNPLKNPVYIPAVEYSDELMNQDPATFIPYDVIDLDGNIKVTESVEMVDSDKNEVKKNGQLTRLGSEQTRNLGCILRERYIEKLKFISKFYDGDEVKIRSTGVQRAMDSARCVLSGLYTEITEPIQMTVGAPDKEILSPNWRSCQYLKMVSQWAWINNDLVDGLKDIRERVQARLSIPEDAEDFHLVYLRDNIVSHKAHGILPEELNIPEVAVDCEKAAVDTIITVFCGGYDSVGRDIILKVGIGRLVGKLVSNMTSNINGESAVKMYLYSGHDTTLLPLLHVFDIFDGDWPPFAANITLELYENKEKKEHFVQTLYEGEPQLIAGCSSTMCPLNEFQAAVNKYICTDAEYDIQCDVEDDDLIRHIKNKQAPSSNPLST